MKQELRCLLLLSTMLALFSSQGHASEHPITLQDIVALREITEQQIAPDGRVVAFTVKDADVNSNDYSTSLYVVPATGGGEPKLLVRAKAISNLRWKPDGRVITYLSTAGTLSQIMQIPSQGGSAAVLFDHPENINSFEWEPHGEAVALISSEPVSADETAAAAEQGIYYNDRVGFPFWDFVTRSWVKKPSRLWVHNLSTGHSKKLWEAKASIHSHFETTSISKLVWAPTGKHIAVQVNAPITASANAAIAFNSGIGVLPVEGGGIVPLPASMGFQTGPSWSPDGKSLAYVGEVETGGKSREGFRATIMVDRLDDDEPPREVTPDAAIHWGTQIWWSKDGEDILFGVEGRDRAALYRVPASGGPVTQVSSGEDHLSDFSLSANQSTVSCIVQDTMKAPEIGVFGLPSGAVNPVTRLNSAFDHIKLGEVSRLRWTNKYGYETNGFLIKPIGYVAGKRYPLLIIVYGFHGEFITDAEWITSYPAQGFAANGFAVLLMNQPKEYGWRRGNFEQFVFDRDWNALASIEAAVNTLNEMGVADGQRVGMMGWSYGSELTTLSLTRTRLFAAASASSGGAYNSSAYWLLGQSFQYYMEGLMGGSPYGDYDRRYDELSTAAHSDRVSAPLLIEAPTSEMLFSLEFYTAMRKQGKPVEFVIYPDEGHIYQQPKHRLASMQRNLDWFNFWLQNKEDPDPAKREQYERWREMRVGLSDGN